jgi:hypothetical protein
MRQHLHRIGLAKLLLLCLAAGCGTTASDSPSESGERKLTPAYEKLGRAFGDLIVSRDYEGAYALIAGSSQSDIPYAEFDEAFRNYREGVEGTLKVEIVAGDPYVKDDSDLLLPDSIRDRVEDEFAIHFEPEGEAEGFSANVWVLMEADQARIAYFFVGD